MTSIKTKAIAYSINEKEAGGSEAWAELSGKLRAQGLRVFRTHGGKSHSGTARLLAGKVLELETEWLYDNQWNTAPFEGSASGYRVFDWCEDALFNASGASMGHIHVGYYLEQSDEMRAARAGRVACGYCGKQYAATEPQEIAGFCGACCDSPYLTEKDLPLTRLFPVTTGLLCKIEPLNASELAAVLPRFTDAQLRGRKARDAAAEAKQRAKVAALVDEAKQKAARKVVAAQREQAGFQWLLDRGFWGLLDNVIYYDHTDTFHFGWRSKEGLPDTVVGQLLDVISEFPAPYEISTATRGKLSGGQG